MTLDGTYIDVWGYTPVQWVLSSVMVGPGMIEGPRAIHKEPSGFAVGKYTIVNPYPGYLEHIRRTTGIANVDGVSLVQIFPIRGQVLTRLDRIQPMSDRDRGVVEFCFWMYPDSDKI